MQPAPPLFSQDLPPICPDLSSSPPPQAKSEFKLSFLFLFKVLLDIKEIVSY